MVMQAWELGKDVFSAVNYVFETIGGDGDLKEKGEKLKKDMGNRAISISTGGNIMKLLTPYIIEPTIIVNKELRNEDVIQDILNMNVEVFTAIYTQAFNILTNVHGLNANYAIELLKSNYQKYGIESVNNDDITSLVGLEDADVLPIKKESIEYLSLEADNEKTASEKAEYDAEYEKEKHRLLKDHKKDEDEHNYNVNLRRKINEDEYNYELNKNRRVKEDEENYNKSRFRKKDEEDSVDRNRYNDRNLKGKVVKNEEIPAIISKEVILTINARVDEGKTKVLIEVPITIKAYIVYTDYNSISNLLEVNSESRSFRERLDDYRSGGIALSDLLFASDLVDKYKHNKLKDKDDLIKAMESRSTKANLKALKKGNIGFAKYFSILVVTERDKARLESAVRGKLDKYKYKEKVLEQTKSILLNVVDLDWERVTLYTKELKGSTDITFKKLSKKKGGDNSSELLKAIFANRQPVL